MNGGEGMPGTRGGGGAVDTTTLPSTNAQSTGPTATAGVDPQVSVLPCRGHNLVTT